MFLVVFRFSWCNYSLIILYDGKTELESIFGGKLFKKAWNCSRWRTRSGWTALFTWCFTCATTNTGDGLLFLYDVSLVQQQTLELVGNCMAYSLLLPILIRLHFKAICTSSSKSSTTSPQIARARFLVYRHRTWEGNTGYALSCRPVNYTCM